MSSKSVTVRRAAIAAPALMFGYGVLRFFDGADGDRGNGLAWDAGHLAFFAAMVVFGVLAVAIRPAVPQWAHRVGSVAAATALVGIGCFLWVITGDLSDSFREAAPLPDVLRTGGSALFPLGMLVLLGLMVAVRRMPVWSPLLFGAGIAAITVNLDMLPIASLIILAALSPLAGDVDEEPQQKDHTGEVSRQAARERFKPELTRH
ncbi:hypothetical protein FB565_006543 [Actinoplanes lutulentus]|uniref:Uncharacterized protein n=1 Tax=Actinoplanes lutulentus TaxID=1287878 RepID=A0A327ZFK7_9ACTN|nr:hypothetical protein [Actinoplanes lutulentus]MBB2946775.1 hypothetical protein [Actinoplanes lutulentus]RAK35667.1 hypothetical protein B0I29_109141 [Actinoplanes lutulentus]